MGSQKIDVAFGLSNLSQEAIANPLAEPAPLGQERCNGTAQFQTEANLPNPVYLRQEIDSYCQLIGLPSEYKRQHDYVDHHTLD